MLLCASVRTNGRQILINLAHSDALPDGLPHMPICLMPHASNFFIVNIRLDDEWGTSNKVKEKKDLIV